MKKKVFIFVTFAFLVSAMVTARSEVSTSQPAKNAGKTKDAFQTAMYMKIDSALFLPECERQLMQITSKSSGKQARSRALKFLDSLLLVVAKTDRINVAALKDGREKSYLVFDLYGTVYPEDITELFELMREKSDAPQPEYVIDERQNGFLVVTLDGNPVFTMINGQDNPNLKEGVLRVIFSDITSTGCEPVKIDVPLTAPEKAVRQCRINVSGPMWFVTRDIPVAGDAAIQRSRLEPQQVWMQTDPKTFIAALNFRFAFTRDAEQVFEQLITRKNDEPVVRLTNGFLTDLSDIRIDPENPCVITGKFDIGKIVDFIITCFNRVCGDDEKRTAVRRLMDIAVAAECYEVDKGKYPDDFAVLVTEGFLKDAGVFDSPVSEETVKVKNGRLVGDMQFDFFLPPANGKRSKVILGAEKPQFADEKGEVWVLFRDGHVEKMKAGQLKKKLKSQQKPAAAKKEKE